MFGGAKIKIDKDLLERVKKVSGAAGYSSPEEFITHIIERELAKLEGAESDEEVKERLKGLGYIS
jgi:metal-responsive CopG/Arc/MetJ family transcriptional regulator